MSGLADQHARAAPDSELHGLHQHVDDSETTGVAHWQGRLTPRDYAALTPLIWARESVWPIRSRHEYAIGVAVIEMAPGDTTVGSTPFKNDTIWIKRAAAIFTAASPRGGATISSNIGNFWKRSQPGPISAGASVATDRRLAKIIASAYSTIPASDTFIQVAHPYRAAIASINGAEIATHARAMSP